MFDIREYYKRENDAARQNYETALHKIEHIASDTENTEESNELAPFLEYFNHTAHFILEIAGYEKRIDRHYFENETFEKLKGENKRLFSEIQPENYAYSYADPARAVARLGDRWGQTFSYFHVKLRQSIQHAFRHKIFKIDEICQAFVKLYDRFCRDGLQYETVCAEIIEDAQKPKFRDSVQELKENFSTEFQYLTDILMQSDLKDPRYLFKYGKSISETEIANSRFIMEYPEEKIRQLSRRIVKSYVIGFRRNNKDISKKSIARIFYPIGYERIVRILIEEMRDVGLNPVIGNLFSHVLNRQYIHDHKFDAALYLSRAYVDRAIQNFSYACEELQTVLSEYSGTLLLENFGEEPFSPEKKTASLKFCEEHHQLTQEYQNRRTAIVEKYMPRSETSFTMISFPSPEIGNEYREIFDCIYDVNMLDTEKYEPMQQRIIDELDRAEYVHIKGKGNSETDIRVKMHTLADPSTQTNFFNCGADVNIPVGEVFTSPKLEGTNGILHIEKAFLEGLRYDNLRLIFEDGNIVDYSCSNYDNAEDNRKYIEENLLFPHKTLPVGEFAIGTNTLAYMASKKYDILKVLPILIIEKMGPHFAIGDTCYRHEEDLPVYNDLDGKEVIARENERSAARKENPEKAYTYCHTDITIPYESIDFIAAITKEGSRIDIIRDGKFVVDGTDELNIPLETM